MIEISIKKPIVGRINQHGLSMIQVLLASSAIAGLALVGLKLSEDQRKLAAKTYENQLVEYLFQEIKGLMQESGVCRATLRDLNHRADTFSFIRRPLKSDTSEDLFAQHYPIYEEDSRANYFNSAVRIMSYEVREQESVNSLSKRSRIGNGGLAGHSLLTVRFEVGNKDTETKREIIKSATLVFQENADKELTTCRLGFPVREQRTDGFWRETQRGLDLQNLKVSLLKSESRVTPGFLNISGALRIQRVDPSPCLSDREGVMENHKGKLVFCREGEWQLVGFRPINWANTESYKVVRNSKGQKETVTARHRLCFLSGQIKNDSNDGCELKKLNQTSLSPFRIIAFATAAATKNICEVTCVD